MVAAEPSEARCTIAEEERLVAFGMQTSRLDERQTVVDLMGRGVDKQPLRSAVTLSRSSIPASCCCTALRRRRRRRTSGRHAYQLRDFATASLR